ncbi:hypothetical protein P8452_38164 [Trifolium repens]|nr:hypothetical protein P8452_38164 [Trifolium repens]
MRFVALESFSLYVIHFKPLIIVGFGVNCGIPVPIHKLPQLYPMLRMVLLTSINKQQVTLIHYTFKVVMSLAKLLVAE